jgi:C4-dicarboxylate transporter, DctQ subunit
MGIIKNLDENAGKGIVLVVTLIMGASLLLQVLSRYLFNMSITWAEEVAIFGMIWAAYFGSSLAVIRRQHIRILVLPQRFNLRVQKMFDIGCNIVFFVIIILVIYGTIQMTTLAYETKQVAAATRLPRWIIIAGLPLAFSLNALRIVQDTLKCVRELKEMKAGQ